MLSTCEHDDYIVIWDGRRNCPLCDLTKNNAAEIKERDAEVKAFSRQLSDANDMIAELEEDLKELQLEQSPSPFRIL
jgi:septal ring factor EnvC (AmiA/AmiB activator)